MNKLLPALIITMIILSCNSYKQHTLRDTLASKCFWDIVKDKQVIGGLNSCFRFLPDGKCFFYYYNFYDKQKTDSVFRYDDDDVIVRDTWSTIGDTLLVARGMKYKVLEFSKESVVLQQRNGDSVFLEKNCKTFLER